MTHFWQSDIKLLPSGSCLWHRRVPEIVPNERENRVGSKYLPAYLLTFVNVLGFSLLLPVLPFVVTQYGGSEMMYGLLISTYSCFQFLGAPWLGRLSDSVGRRPVLLISQAGTLLSWFVFGAAWFVPGYRHWSRCLTIAGDRGGQSFGRCNRWQSLGDASLCV